MKKLFAIILSMALLTGLLAGCNGKQATSSSNSSSASISNSVSISALPVSISLWIMPLYETFIDTVKAKLPAAIKAVYPNITLNTELLSWDAGPEKLTVAMATNTTPDFMQDGLSRLASGITAGLCADVTDLMGKLKPIILEGFLKEGMKDGKKLLCADQYFQWV